MSGIHKSLAVFLSVVLFFGAFSAATPVFAQEVTDAIEHYEFVQDAINNPAIAEDTAPEAEIAFEVEEKRDEYTKVYKKDDGTYTAVMSAEPLHYLNDGAWEEINNSLLLNGDIYSNAENSFTVEVPENINSNENLTVEKDGYEISFSVGGISESSAVVENNIVASETDVLAADEAIAQTQSSVTYSNIAENTDLQYVVTSNSIKENIIVSDKESVKETYTFTFETNGLNVEKQDDGSVDFKDDAGDVKFRIPRPVMTDSALAFSYDIAVELIYNTDGTITLEYSPSLEWVNSTDRVYPINIDPAIVVGDKNSVWVEDTYIMQDSLINTSADNYYNAAIGGVINIKENIGEENERTRYSEIYTKLNMERAKVLGDNVIFTEVQYLFLGYTTNGCAIAKKIASSNVVDGEVDLAGIGGSQRLQLENEAIDYYTSPFTGYEGLQSAYMHFNITKPFNDWYRGEPNNGFAVVPGNEGFYSAIVLNGTSTDYYLNQMGYSYATVIVLDYVDLGGYNPKYTYDISRVGRAGTSYVNLLTQQLTVIRDDFSITGENEFTLGMMFDSATSQKLKELGHTGVLAYGNNWIPNYLRAYLFVDENHVNYYTRTGSVVEFLRSTDDNGNTVFTELLYGSNESSGYKFAYYSSTEDTQEYYTITTPEGYVEKFNSFGLLVSETISENPLRRINVQYDNELRIARVTDIYGGTYTYAYEDTGLVSAVTYASANGETTRTSKYEYDLKKNLIGIEAVDENNRNYVCRYEYYGNGSMSEIVSGILNDDGTATDAVGVRYTYDESGKIKELKELTYIDGGLAIGDGAVTTYTPVNATQVEVTDAQNNYKVYSFDIKGKHLYTYDSATGAIIFEERQNENVFPNIYNYSENYKLNNWQSSSDFVRSEENNEPVFEIQGGVEDETVLYQTINCIGDKGDEIVISGWVKGIFIKSQTDSTWLQEIIESDDESVLNFTHDRFAQVEISYQYQGTNENGVKQKYDETVVIPLVENIDGWQLASERFILKGTCKSITVCIRFSKNANSAILSDFNFDLNKLCELKLKNGLLTKVICGDEVVLEYEYTKNGLLGKMIYYNEFGEKTTFEYMYPEDNEHNEHNGYNITDIIVNGKTRHTYNYENGHVSKISSADNRIVRYVDKNTQIPTFANNPIYAIENNGNIYTETIGGLIYTTTINEETYAYDTVNGDFKDCFFTESSNILSESGKGIGVKIVQDWYGRRMSDTVQLKDKDVETEDLFAKLETVYGYGEDVSFETLNDIKTYTNTVFIPNEQGVFSENHSFSYEYDENGNIVEEYAYISENSIELRYSYQYNDKNQLVRYNDNVSAPKRSYTYTYDDSGRVLSKSTYTYAPLGTELGELISTENYEYNGNVLTEYGNNPVENNVSNYPTSYEGATLTWANNQLTSYTYTENDENSNPIVKRISYTYGENGYLSSKLVETKKEDGSFTQSEKYDYTWAYGKVINQVHTSYENGAETKTVIRFVYDSYNSVQGFIVNDTASYIYLKNLQGDIVGVVDETGDEIATYSYDVWGKQTVTTTQNIVGLLPLAYRGYFFDNYANLYFIDKRAYNPEWGKFLDSASAEAQGMPSISEYNMYTYWENNSVWYMTNEEKEAYKVNSIANYLHNQGITQDILNYTNKTQEELFIYKQSAALVKDYRCGAVTSGSKGCAWISTYNASKLLGYNLKPEEIIKEYEEMGIFMQGFFGVHPFAVARFFTKRGHDIDVYFGDFNDLDNLNNLSEVNIMFYDGVPTGHYAAIQYDEKDKNNPNDDVFEGYNVFGSSGTETLKEGIAIPVTETNYTREYTGKVLISITPKEQATVSS